MASRCSSRTRRFPTRADGATPVRRRRREVMDPAGRSCRRSRRPGTPSDPDRPVAPTNPLTDPHFVAGLRPVPVGDRRRTGGHGARPTCPGWIRTASLSASISGPPCVRAARVPVDQLRRLRPVLGGPPGRPAVRCRRGRRDQGAGRRAASEVAAAAAASPLLWSCPTPAWVDYRVTSYPFLVLVEPRTRRILGESVGFGWSDVAVLLDAGDHRSGRTVRRTRVEVAPETVRSRSSLPGRPG